jgi:hypothetical protein
MLIAAFLEGERRFTGREVLNGVFLSARPKTRQQVHAIKGDDRVGDVRLRLADRVRAAGNEGVHDFGLGDVRFVLGVLALVKSGAVDDNGSSTTSPILRRPFLRCGQGVGSLTSCALNAAFRAGGNALPLRSALLNIPAHAVGLKKNLGGSTPVSKTRDNEDSTATLGDSEVLSVQDPHGEPVAELHQRPEEGTKVPSTI